MQLLLSPFSTLLEASLKIGSLRKVSPTIQNTFYQGVERTLGASCQELVFLPALSVLTVAITSLVEKSLRKS